MRKKSCFLWVDDDAKRIAQYKATIEGGIPGKSWRAKVESLIVGDNLIEALQSRSQAGQTKPDLVIIDHIFTRLNHPLKLKGSFVANLLRGAWQDVPMVCVTSMMARQAAFDQQDLSEYTAVFEYPRLDDHLEDLYAIARDFPRLKVTKADLRDDIVVSLKAPKDDRDSLKRILPEEIRTQQHTTTQHRIARWVFNTLMKRPGFLYNTLRAATLLGLTERGYEKVAPLFEKAKYSGPFMTSKRPLWWVSELQRCLYAKVSDDAPDIPQLAGRMLPGITPKHHSVCYVSKSAKNIPDAVARADTRSKTEHQVNSRFTAPDPDDVGVFPGFESLLVIAKKSKK